MTVKCNTALAETLINLKKQEISVIENHYNSNISFVFDDHFSLHEPTVESKEKKLEENKIKNKNIKSKINIKKKNIVRKKQTTNKKSYKKSTKLVEKNKEKIEKTSEKISSDDLKNTENIEEKTGWWS